MLYMLINRKYIEKEKMGTLRNGEWEGFSVLFVACSGLEEISGIL